MSKTTLTVAMRTVGRVQMESPTFGHPTRPVYMASRPVLCAICRCLITPLSAFTKTRPHGETKMRPVCWTCRPFRVGKSAA